MHKRRIALIAAISIGCCAVLAGGYFFVLPIVFPAPDIAPRIAAIDEAIAGGYLSTARAQLLAIRPFPRGDRDALRLLKRAFILSREAGDFGLLAGMADRALASRSQGQSIRLVAAYSYLRTGRLSDAEAVERRGLPGGAGDLVRGETVLRRGSAWQGSDSLTRDLLKLETSRQASDFIAMARRVDDRRLGLDAALLSLEKGDLEGARVLAVSSLQDAAFDEPAALIAYDTGDFETAIMRLNRLQTRRTPTAETALLLADCYQALGRIPESQDAMREAIRLDPKLSWTPYADLGHAAEEKGDVSLARATLAQGRALFPGSRELVLATARLETGQGNQESALALLDVLVAQRPDDAEAALLRLGLKAPGLSPQAYRAEMWRLFDRLPSNQEVFLTLASALVASHDWDGAGVAIHQHEIAQGTNDPDTLCIRALVDAMQGRESRAVDSFAQAVGQNGSTRYRYDLAVLLLRRGDPQAALAQLAQARDEMAPEVGARIETLKGRCMLATGDLSGARGAFLRAQAVDPHSLRPAMELRKLEAPGDQ